ncbi:SAM-dependent methyltransferase [Corynebacterium sp. UBA2622]|uniref:SAM-dependent methyltransferase n=1 Tax=Corynebacterium sp. UBA2622 TaxID=1946393 RepID=UPI0025BE2975|nr:class I SAM-dependent methyltransferase [Corynebacterium sp. UBA2622]
MVSARLSSPHLTAVDEAAWPGVATVPSGWMAGVKARAAERAFAKACAQAGIELDPEAGADVVVERAELFARIGESGWVGLAEGYMAGEWSTGSTDSLVDVLASLISAGYRPRNTAKAGFAESAGGDVPPELVQHYAGDGMSAFTGHFATGVPTTERTRVKSFAPGAGRGNRPAAHFVDVTSIGAPLEAGREDLAHAQHRTVEMLLDSSSAGPGTHLVEYPASGGAVAIEAARRRATVDCITPDPGTARALEERLTLAGVRDAVRVERDAAAGTRRRGYYDAAVSVEKLETLAPRDKTRYLAILGNLLEPGGRAVLQTVTRTGAYNAAADAAVESMRAYVWPGLSFSTPEEIARMIDRGTGLRVIGETHAPDHLAASLRLQRLTFDTHLREAAADGFDVVYRRLWQWQFALREALARCAMTDLVQLTFAPRSRHR